MIYSDLHVHTTYCDGKNTPEEVVKQAIEMGMETLGLVVHSHTFFDESYCASPEGARQFRREMALLKQKYKNKINLLCGVEQDYYSTDSTDEFDYVIGSVHYLYKNDEYLPVDESGQYFLTILDNYYGGDICSLISDYYMQVSDVVNRTGADIIGHFDLIKKFNGVLNLFSENDKRYVDLSTAAALKLIKTGKKFEINTGGISRGYTAEAYPSERLIEFIKQNGGSFILSSDSHVKETLLYGFNEYEKFIE